MTEIIDRIGPVMAEYVQAALDRFGAQNRTPMRVVTYQPGSEVAWDGCCDGQLWARVVTIQPGPVQPKASGIPCGVPWMDVTLGLGIIRCVAGPSSKGQPPSAAKITDDGAVMLLDLAVLQEAMLCVGKTVRVVAWTPLGPQGDCAGGEWTFTIRILTCACPEH